MFLSDRFLLDALQGDNPSKSGEPALTFMWSFMCDLQNVADNGSIVTKSKDTEYCGYKYVSVDAVKMIFILL
jgi:hypothetical protein